MKSQAIYTIRKKSRNAKEETGAVTGNLCSSGSVKTGKKDEEYEIRIYNLLNLFPSRAICNFKSLNKSHFYVLI